jgi:hypothetical protein
MVAKRKVTKPATKAGFIETVRGVLDRPEGLSEADHKAAIRELAADMIGILSVTNPIVFLVTVDGVQARVVLNPQQPKVEDRLIIEAFAGTDGVGNPHWKRFLYRDTERFVAAALLYASIFGGTSGKPVDTGAVDRTRVRLTLPAGFDLLFEQDAGRLLGAGDGSGRSSE